MKKLNCSNCGAPIKIQNKYFGVCEYCGTSYKLEETNSNYAIIKIHDSKSMHYRARYSIPMNTFLRAGMAYSSMRDKTWTEIMEMQTKKAITNELAEKLTDAIEFRSEFNPVTNTMDISGDIRILKPDFRF